MILSPGQDGCGHELVVADDHAWATAAEDQRRQLACYAPARYLDVGDRRQALACHVEGPVEDAETQTTGELIMDEVQRPTGIGLRLDQERRPRADGAATGLAPAHHHTFLAIEAVNTVLARELAFPPQQDEQPPIVEPASLGSPAAR